VHVHDIFMPMEYPRDWIIKMMRFWDEQYLLQAFLAFNQAFEVIWAGSYMNVKYPKSWRKPSDLTLKERLSLEVFG